MVSSIVSEIIARPELIKDAFPVITIEELNATEQALGFELPALIRELYQTVGNGGFGPHFGGFLGGVNGYEDDYTIAETYRLNRSEPERFLWPEKLLPFFHWGCACFCCIDCGREVGDIVFYDPGYFKDYFADDDPKKERDPVLTDPVPAMKRDARSLEEWLRRWIDGSAEMGNNKARWRPLGWRPVNPPKRLSKTDRGYQFKLEL